MKTNHLLRINGYLSERQSTGLYSRMTPKSVGIKRWNMQFYTLTQTSEYENLKITHILLLKKYYSHFIIIRKLWTMGADYFDDHNLYF